MVMNCRKIQIQMSNSNLFCTPRSKNLLSIAPPPPQSMFFFVVSPLPFKNLWAVDSHQSERKNLKNYMFRSTEGSFEDHETTFGIRKPSDDHDKVDTNFCCITSCHKSCHFFFLWFLIDFLIGSGFSNALWH